MSKLTSLLCLAAAAWTAMMDNFSSSCVVLAYQNGRHHQNPATTTTSKSDQQQLLKHQHEYSQATIDFSSANDYIQDQYGHVIPQPYFATVKEKVPIYDARRGVLDDTSGLFRTPTLGFCGFEVRPHVAQVKDWTSLEDIRSNYFPELRRQVEASFPFQKVVDVVFWHPVLRGQEFSCAKRFDKEEMLTANMAVADVAHIDIDFGAYDDCYGIAELVCKNALPEAGRGEKMSPKDLGKVLEHRRFAVINAWRNVQPDPIANAPLGLLHTQYNTLNVGFPDVVPSPSRSNWYSFPKLTNQELLLFYQYDRHVSKCSDLWHQALFDIQGDASQKRKSFDVRMLVIFDEQVPAEFDRLHPQRTRTKPEDDQPDEE